MSMEGIRIIADADLLPEVLLKVIEAKKLLSQGKAKNSSEAARLAGISRSAYYKYKDGVAVYNEELERKLVTYYLMLMDVPGVLSNVLAALSKNGANVLTINQSIPVDGAAPVTISFATRGLLVDEHSLRQELRAIDGVVSCRSFTSSK